MFAVFENGSLADFIIEKSACNGVKRVARTVCRDISYVAGQEPACRESVREATGEYAILAGVYGESALIDELEGNGQIDFTDLRDKRECYLMKETDSPFAQYPHIKKALVIVGSDKRGAIYGLFHLSELCGIPPLIYWGDAVPGRKEQIILNLQGEIRSKEPSVKYRGFFINDEWPAFGGWCNQQFGGFNAQAYEKVFELVLRLKGNYLWPAMWSASFWQDGPGLENARLADEYGIIMGTSHSLFRSVSGTMAFFYIGGGHIQSTEKPHHH